MYRMMKLEQRAIKPYLELTTASLLKQRGRWASWTGGLPQGGLLLVAPQNNPKIQACLLRIAQSFRELGGEVLLCQTRLCDEQGP